MANIDISTPPSSARQWTRTPTGSRANSKTVSSPSRSLSPRHFPLLLSPPTASPEGVHFDGPTSTAATGLKIARTSSNSVLDCCISPKSPNSWSAPRSPPPRPARPPTALPNIRPTIILSPFLVSSLPPADRPLLSKSLNGECSFSTSSTSPSQPTFSSKSSTSDSRSCYSSLAPPSPCFFGSTSWPTTQSPATPSPKGTTPTLALSARSPQRLVDPAVLSTRPKRPATGEAHSRYPSRDINNGSAPASSRNSRIPPPHAPSPPPFPPPTAPLPPTPYINTTTNSEASLGSTRREKQLHHDSFYHHCRPLIRCHAEAEGALALAHELNGNDGAVDEEAVPRPWRSPHRRRLWMLGTAALVALLVGGILAGIVWKLDGK